MLKYLLLTILAFLGLGLILYLVNPFAPLLLLGSLIIQLPIVYFIAKHSYGGAYAQRVQARKEQFEQDGDTAHWLAKEEQEVASFGYKLLSPKAKTKNALLRARLLSQLNRNEEAQRIWRLIDPELLEGEDRKEYESLSVKM